MALVLRVSHLRLGLSFEEQLSMSFLGWARHLIIGITLIDDLVEARAVVESARLIAGAILGDDSANAQEGMGRV
jgi:hypothetical protein